MVFDKCLSWTFGAGDSSTWKYSARTILHWHVGTLGWRHSRDLSMSRDRRQSGVDSHEERSNKARWSLLDSCQLLQRIFGDHEVLWRIRKSAVDNERWWFAAAQEAQCLLGLHMGSGTRQGNYCGALQLCSRYSTVEIRDKPLKKLKQFFEKWYEELLRFCYATTVKNCDLWFYILQMTWLSRLSSYLVLFDLSSRISRKKIHSFWTIEYFYLYLPSNMCWFVEQ